MTARPALVFQTRRFDGSATSIQVADTIVGHWALNQAAVPSNIGRLGFQLSGVVNGNNNSGVPWADIAGGLTLWVVVGGEPDDDDGEASDEVEITSTVFATPMVTVNLAGLFADGRTVEFIKVLARRPGAAGSSPNLGPYMLAVTGELAARQPLARALPSVELASALGVDVDCVADIDPQLSLASGLRNLGNALLRRLTTPRGGLFYDLDYGLDLRDYLNAGLTDQQLTTLGSAVGLECEKDERVASCAARLTYDRASYTLRVRLAITTADGDDLTLVLQVSQVTAAVLAVQAA